MIQLSCLLLDRSIADFQAPPAPLRLSEHTSGVRLTGRWDHNRLQEGRLAAASWLEAAGFTEAVDLFSGQVFQVRTWLEPLTLANVFSARHALIEGRIWARLFGLYALGESDVVASVDADMPIEALYRLLSHYGAFRLEEHRQASERRRDRPLPYGYWFLGLADSDVADADFWGILRDALYSKHLREAFDDTMETPAPLFLMEAPAVDGEFGSFELGVSRAARLEDDQLRAARRFGVVGRVLAPSAHDAAGICDRLEASLTDAATNTELFAYREAPQGDLDSGWRFGCLDPDHAHDRDAFRIVPLHRAISLNPAFVDYLALPVGAVVSRDEGAMWVQPPGDTKSYRDEDGPPP